MKKFIVLVIGLHIFGLINPANADEVGGVSGQIKDANGHPVSNAKVSIEGKSDFTDDEGQYRIKGLAAGKYKLRVKKEKSQLEGNVEIKDTVMKKDLSLKP